MVPGNALCGVQRIRLADLQSASKETQIARDTFFHRRYEHLVDGIARIITPLRSTTSNR
jgi:hypothetical protein